MKPDIMVITPHAGVVTLHPLGRLVRLDWHEPTLFNQGLAWLLQEQARNLAKQWLLNEGWIALASQSIEIDQQTIDYLNILGDIRNEQQPNT